MRQDDHFGGLLQYCNNSIANAMELLQSCVKPSTWRLLEVKKTVTSTAINVCSYDQVHSLSAGGIFLIPSGNEACVYLDISAVTCQGWADI